MPDKFKIATAVLALVIIHDTRVGLHNKAIAKRIREDNETLRTLLDEAHKRSSYLASVIDKNEIELDDFDAIAIVNPL